MGDEFSVRLFTLDGYTLIKNKGELEYAKLDTDGNLVSSGIEAKNEKI